MSQPPPYPPPYGGPPRRARPRVIWFVIGGLLLVLAPVVFAGSLFVTLRPLMQEDAVFAADGRPHQIELPAGQERALFVEDGLGVDCAVSDVTGNPVGVQAPGGSFTYQEWRAVGRFDTGDGDLTFTCSASGADARARIAQLPSTEGFVGGLLVGILVPLVLGLAGIVMLIVTGVLFATGVPRRAPQQP